jgi:phosphate-selective porin OprO/OprP
MRSIVPALIALATLTASAADETNLAARVAALEQRLAAVESEKPNALKAYWKNGFIFETTDQQFRLQPFGRIQFDTAFFDADPSLEEANAPFDDGTKFRRARLGLRGTMYENTEFVAEYDFASSTAFRSVYMGLKEVPVVGNLRAGHMIEPFGLEELCSNNYISFMERGFTSAFTPVENTGFMVFDTAAQQRMTWAVGVFKETGPLGDSVSNEEFAVTARLTGLPYASENGREYLHLGYSHSYRGLDDAGYRVRARPESSIAPYVVDTKNLDADTTHLHGLETILTLGRFSLQGEWMLSAVDLNATEDAPASDADLSAYYLEATCFLTGEYRPYVRKDALPGRVIPQRNVAKGSLAGGAWEVGARYNSIDLNDGAVNGGAMDSVALGLNWYLNPQTRVMWNYAMSDVEDEGDVDTFEMRVQIDF